MVMESAKRMPMVPKRVGARLGRPTCVQNWKPLAPISVADSFHSSRTALKPGISSSVPRGMAK